MASMLLANLLLLCCIITSGLRLPCANFAPRLVPLQDSVQDGTDGAVTNVGVVLLAGGKGTRMKASMPKQFLPLLGKPIFLRSLDVFQSMPASVVSSIVIVLDPMYREEYGFLLADKRISFADPGKERQDSVLSGITGVPDGCSLVAIHDSARPLVTCKEVLACLSDAKEHGAAVLGVPCKATIKESEDGAFVLKTINRSRLWEIHTPQVATKALFLEGFALVKKDKLEVTDDVSVVEALGRPVKLTLGEYTNIKMTTPDDIAVATQILLDRGVVDESKKADQDNSKTAGFPCASERYRDSLSPSQEKETESAKPVASTGVVAAEKKFSIYF